MASDDMHVIMYKILSYLYSCMKKGVEPSMSMLAHDGDLMRIPYGYWVNVMRELEANGYVRGITVIKMFGGEDVIVESPVITIDGVEFMRENGMMRKALDFLKETKSAIPFI